MTPAMEHCHRPWWKRPPLWFIVIAAVLALVVGVVIEESGKRAPTPYGTFLDQLDAGNVASVTFQGMEIDGRFKQPLDSTPSSGAVQRDTFRSRVPDFGDPTLIPELRKQHVVINVTSTTSWTRLFAGLPWPMLLFIGVALIAGLVRLARGGKAQSGSAMPMHPMQGMVGLVSGLFGKQNQTPSSPPHDGDGTKSG